MPSDSASPSPRRPDDLRRVTRLAAYGLIVRGGRILLCRVAPGNLGAGLWTLPGGGLDFGEGPEADAILGGHLLGDLVEHAVIGLVVP